MTKEHDSRNPSELTKKGVTSVKKFLQFEFVAWSGAPRINHYFQVWLVICVLLNHLYLNLKFMMI